MSLDSTPSWESRETNGKWLWNTFSWTTSHCHSTTSAITIVGYYIEDVISIDDIDSMKVGGLQNSKTLDVEE